MDAKSALGFEAPTSPIGCIVAERQRQDEKWGADRTFPDAPVVSDMMVTQAELEEDLAREACDDAGNEDRQTWLHILNEELAEVQVAALIAARAPDPDAAEGLRDELVQVAAVCVSWIEDIDRRAAVPAQAADVVGPLLDEWLEPPVKLEVVRHDPAYLARMIEGLSTQIGDVTRQQDSDDSAIIALQQASEKLQNQITSLVEFVNGQFKSVEDHLKADGVAVVGALIDLNKRITSLEDDGDPSRVAEDIEAALSRYRSENKRSEARDLKRAADRLEVFAGTRPNADQATGIRIAASMLRNGL